MVSTGHLRTRGIAALPDTPFPPTLGATQVGTSEEPMEASRPGADAPNELRGGPRDSLDELMPVVYEHLRLVARRQLAIRPGGGTLSTTGLVHEAYLKLVGTSHEWRDRAHFFATASVAMRQVLVDRAKARFAQKREGGFRRVTLDSEVIDVAEQPDILLEINDAVNRLAVVEPRLARVVECRFFGGLSEEETAEALDMATRTVQRDWAKARMLLRRALSA